jgi:phosphatidylethanolamine-binding protein (PEBP) family uncharacterized protein
VEWPCGIAVVGRDDDDDDESPFWMRAFSSFITTRHPSLSSLSSPTPPHRHRRLHRHLFLLVALTTKMKQTLAKKKEKGE